MISWIKRRPFIIGFFIYIVATIASIYLLFEANKDRGRDIQELQGIICDVIDKRTGEQCTDRNKAVTKIKKKGGGRIVEVPGNSDKVFIIPPSSRPDNSVEVIKPDIPDREIKPKKKPKQKERQDTTENESVQSQKDCVGSILNIDLVCQ